MAGADAYFIEGCGRCSYGGTPQCKVHRWEHELQLLRNLILECGLTETRKWGVPCYMHQQKNVILIGAFKDCYTISFLGGHALSDPHQMLELPGPNSREDRVIRFTDPTKLLQNRTEIQRLIREAMILSASERKQPLPKTTASIPEELNIWFAKEKGLKEAFYALTPGRQRGYLLHFNQASQSATRHKRIEKSIAQILAGKGRQDP